MVTILPRDPSLGEDLGTGLGMALSQAGQRYQTQQALNNAKNEMKNPDLSNSDKLFSLVKGLAGIPGAERYIGPLFETLSKHSNYNASANINPGAAFSSNSDSNSRQPGFDSNLRQEQVKRQSLPEFRTNNSFQANGSSSNVENDKQELTQALEKLQSLGLEPPQRNNSGQGSLSPTEPGVGLIPTRYSREQRIAERQKLSDRGLDPRLADEALDSYERVEEKIIKDINDAQHEKAAHAQERRASQEKFREYAEKNLENVGADDFHTFLNISEQPQFEKLGSDAARYQASKKIFDLYQKQKNSLINLGQRPNFFSEDKKIHERAAKNAVQPLINVGQRDLATRLLQEDLGYGPVTTAETINNLPQELYKKIDNIPDFNPSKAPMPGIQGLDEYQRKQKKFQEEWTNLLKNEIKPGKYDPRDPNQYKLGTSLFILEDKARQKGMGAREFFDIVENLNNEGKINLDDYQRDELTQLSQPEYKRYGLGEILWRAVPGYKPKR